jgi:hypothetical protein
MPTRRLAALAVLASLLAAPAAEAGVIHVPRTVALAAFGITDVAGDPIAACPGPAFDLAPIIGASLRNL